MAKLSAKRQLFVDEFLKLGNAAAAYRAAGYKVKNDNVAAVEGHRLLSNPKIAAAIANAQAARSARTQIDADWVVKRLQIEATLEGEDSSHAARVSALKALGEHLGMFVKRLEHSGPGGKPIPIAFVNMPGVEPDVLPRSQPS